MKTLLFAVLVLCAGLVAAMGTPPQPGGKPAASQVGTASVMLRDDDLRAQPDSASALVTRVAKGSAVRVIASQGGWTQVSTQGRLGWVRILSVRGGVTGSPADLAALGAAALKGRDPDKVVAVAGVRGLTEHSLAQATFNQDELLRLETYAVSAEEAERHARDAALQRRAMAYLAAPKRADARPVDTAWPWEGY